MSETNENFKKVNRKRLLFNFVLNLFISSAIIVLSIINGYYKEVWKNIHYDAVTTFWVNGFIIFVVSLLLFILTKYVSLSNYDSVVKVFLLISIPICMYCIIEYSDYIYIDIDKVILLWSSLFYILIDNTILKRIKNEKIG